MALKICAFKYISLSEIQKVQPKFTSKYIEDNKDEFLQVLHNLGCDTKEYVMVQHDIQHRNIFNEIVTCDRYVCDERIDDEWLNSGYASIEARDKAIGSKILTDSYRLRGLVESV